MQTLISFRALACLRLLFLATVLALFSACTSHITVPVKTGQTSINPKRLPFACLSIATVDAVIPLEKVIIENLATHESMTAQLGKTFNADHPDYPIGTSGAHDFLSMVVMELPPGRYQVKSIEFTPVGPTRTFKTCTLILPKDELFSFTVKPACVNYVGRVAIKADWSYVLLPVMVLDSFQSKFSAQFRVEDTATQDVNWAARVIPCLKSLPSTESVMGKKL